MKRIKTRKKHFRISNPLGFSLFCAMVILVIGLIVGAVFLIRGGYVRQWLGCVKSELINDGTPTPTDPVAEATQEATEAPSAPTADPGTETPGIGTPVPETPTPPPITPDTPDPDSSAGPTRDPNAPLAGYTIGIDPTRDGGSKYKAEGEYNLAFAEKLGAFLESKGADVVITRDNNKKSFSNTTRAKTIKNGGCDIAIRLMCNEAGSSTHGCYVQATKKNRDFGQILIDAYSSGTGMKIQSGKGKGVDKISSDDVASKCGCPCVRLILGNWKNKSDRSDLEDDAFRDKMMQAIYEGILKQLGKN